MEGETTDTPDTDEVQGRYHKIVDATVVEESRVIIFTDSDGREFSYWIEEMGKMSQSALRAFAVSHIGQWYVPSEQQVYDDAE